MAHDQIRLDDLLARDVSVQWFEGIALVQAVCRQLSARNASQTQFPGASQIALGADGTVMIAGAAATKSVPAAGHLLARLLSEDAPVRLRLLITQATAEDAETGSLHEFSESLAYFERPDPEGILRGLYERAMVAAPAARPQRAADVFPVEESPATSVAEPAVKKRSGRRTAVAAGVLIALTAGFLIRAGARSGHFAVAAAGLADVVASSPEAPVEEPGASGGNSQDSGNQAAPESRRRTMSPRAGVVTPKKAGGHEVFPTITAPFADTLNLDRVAPEIPADALRYDVAHEMVAHAAGSLEQIYSRNDPAVTPPRQVYPALPAKPSPGTRAEDLTVLDLVVSAEGVVEHVRMRTPPRDIHEFMLVSAAKAWRFEPATLHGQPVRFRHSVAITTD